LLADPPEDRGLEKDFWDSMRAERRLMYARFDVKCDASNFNPDALIEAVK